VIKILVIKTNVELNMRADNFIVDKGDERFCKLLHALHLLLWKKKPLDALKLKSASDCFSKKTKEYFYLTCTTRSNTFELTSDRLCNTSLKSYEWIEDVQNSRGHLSNGDKDELPISWTIGNYIVFPKGTTTEDGFNQARGKCDKICDRFDLSLECIRLWYKKERDQQSNPLVQAINRSEKFFDLFGDFKGYVQFFLLDDLVDEEYNKVKFFLPFGGFDEANPNYKSPLSKDENQYHQYRDNVESFILARNKRIDEIDEYNPDDSLCPAGQKS
jgi:hypothetical protein